ncbi:hypothetical protein K1T71_004637 [Dendrolimus kikuchii]|uniref:Uncharacterized protein n=1 Tax=Dendrolimus kikuchii TaxID=765133 RepID=A0ACC1D8P2_9NEOP|nr:hypothetical protein K1T71_004637 [Dendrolimus kikuchii]
MDDIYEDLENYNDAEEIKRLRSENQFLKSKIEDNGLEIKKLQEDLDRITEEYHKLERNYSSLLKTARQEIERKTQTITNLNIDKDVMIVNYVQNNNNRKILRPKTHCDCPCIHTKKPKEEKSLISKECNIIKLSSTLNVKLETKEQKRDTITENKNKCVIEKDNEIKVDKKPLSIRDRRKSMPILSDNPVKFNSDDEYEVHTPRETKRSKDNTSKDNNDRRLASTNGNAKGKKTSKTPSTEEKSSHYHDLPKHRTRRGTRWENERGLRDKYDNSKPRRYSPERHNWRENPYQKLEKRRTRVLESPPHDKYDRYHSKNHRDSRHYDRPQPYDFDKHRYYDDKPTKHKLPTDYEEPIKKRPRFDSQRRYPVDDKIRYEVEMESDSLADTLEQLESQYASCQSPDYEQMDALTSHPLKEIRETASSPLEDPRETSKRYVLRLDDKGKKTLTTVIGRNVQVKSINRENWCLPKFNVPELLVNQPLHCDEHIIKDIYGDIDDVHVAHNISMESGEILEPLSLNRSKAHDNLESHQNSSVNNKLNDQEKDQKQTESSKQVSFDKYRIPKIKHCDNKINLDNPIKSLSEESRQIPKEPSKDTTKNEKGKVISEKEKPFIFSSTYNKNGHEKNNECPGNDKLASHNIEYHISIKGIVEGDLELSDETSDNTELKHLYVNKTEQCEDNKMKDQGVINKNTQTSVVEGKDKEIIADKPKSAQNSRRKGSNKEDNSKRVSPVSIAKSKSRKKSHKQKDIEEIESCSKPVQQEKKVKSKKDKEPKEINSSKFKELFGTDSSSLITPEDLGLAPSKVSGKYVPLFEDAQDATDVEQIAKVKQDLMDIEKHLDPKTNEGDHTNNASRVNNIEESKNTEINRRVINSKSPPISISVNNISLVENTNHLNDASLHNTELLDNSTSIVNITPIGCATATLVSIANLKPDIRDLSLTSNNDPLINSTLVAHTTTAVSSALITRALATATSTTIAIPTYIDRTTDTAPAVVSNFTHSAGTAAVTKIDSTLVGINAGTSTTMTNPTLIHRTAGRAPVTMGDFTFIDRTAEMTPATMANPTLIDGTAGTASTSMSNITFIDSTNSIGPAIITNPTVICRTADTAPIGNPAHSSNFIPKTDMYTNLNPGKSKDSDVVKTIIISSGTQPQSVETPINARIEPLVVNMDHLGEDAMPNEFKYKNLESLKALATSTPHKELKTSPQPVLKVNDSINSSNDLNKANVITEKSESSVSVSQSEIDVPDVRIFVQRRRKIRKKPAS